MATSATQHNHRLELTPNADPDWGTLNQEYLNHKQCNYWHLASERIAELPRLRGDAVHVVEILLMASPGAFPRDAEGRAQDVRKTSWVQDNLIFMQQRFGKENVIGFTLHQDEIPPHIHAMMVPITADSRLSCRDVFSPATLRQLQTDYAAAMKKQRHYGAQQTSKEKLAEIAAPVKATPFRLDKLKPWERVRPQNDPLPEALATLARNQRAKHMSEVNQVLAKQLCPPLRELTDLALPLLTKGYELKIAELEVLITHQREGIRFSATELRPNGRPLLEQFQQVVAQTQRQFPPRGRDSKIEM